MLEHVLVPVGVDGSAEALLSRLAGLLPAATPRVTLLHVIETVEDTSYDELEPFYEGLRRKAEGALQGLARTLAAPGRQVDVRIVFGRRGPEIVRQAVETAADLVALASHRADPADPARGFWSISHQVAIMAPCSVLMLR